jgi:molecular chaperone DnaJ
MSEGFRDPWVVLGVTRSDDSTQIKRAYRKLAMEHHPDRNPGDPQAAAIFEEVARAYEAIGTDEARALWLAKAENFEDDAFPDLGAEGGRRIEREVELSFAQAFNGEQIEIEVEVSELCARCGGSGVAAGHSPVPCESCRGRGNEADGAPCRSCGGRGFVIDRPCEYCQAGRVIETRPYALSVPAGVINGHRLRLPGPDRGRAGEMIVTVKVRPSPVFQRTLADPADLLVEVPISYAEACFGATIRIPTPSKVIEMRIPPATPSGKAFRISGEGMPRLGQNSRGDLYARVQIAVPAKMSGAHKRLVRELAQLDGEDPRSRLFRPEPSESGSE